MFRDVGTILLEIYQVNFPHEVNGNYGGMAELDMWKNTERSLFELLADYDICPSLLSKSTAYQAYSGTKEAPQAIYQSTSLDILALTTQ